MKKILNSILAVVVIASVLTLAACSNPAGVSENTPQAPEGFVFVKGGTVQGADIPDIDSSAFAYYKGVFISDRTVTLSDFYMSKYEVTQSQYSSVMTGQKVTVDGVEKALNANPSYCTVTSEDYKIDAGVDHKDHPVEGVTWYDAVYYCNALSIKEGLKPCYDITVTTVSDNGNITEATVTLKNDGTGYCLPTEAEWEYAARGGDTTQPDWNYTFSGADKATGTKYSDSKNAGLDSVGWYGYNNITGTTGVNSVTGSVDGKGTHKVGQKAPNRLGLYDMSGNVWEWCYDGYGTIDTGSVTDPVGPASGNYRVLRGGGWARSASNASVSIRGSDNPDNRNNNLGFRVVRPSSK